MSPKIAAILTATLILFAAAKAQAFDSSPYHGQPAIEILVSGDVNSILLADSKDTQNIMIYSMSLAGRLHYLWRDRMSAEFGDDALLKVMEVVNAGTMATDRVNALLKLGTIDADIFAAQYDFNSEAAQKLIMALSTLINV